MGKHNKKKNEEGKGEGTSEKPLPKLVLKVNKEHKKQDQHQKEHKKHKDSKHRDKHHEQSEADHSHHKKKKKKHKHQNREKEKDRDEDRTKEKDKKSRKRELVPEPSQHETPSKKPHLRNKEKEKKDLPKERAIPPLSLCLGNMMRNLQRKDVYNIFQFPVSDAVAPGYSKVIKQPMDFMTMSQKIESNEYSNIDEMKSDFVLMCNNALLYNGPDTIYYKSADKMLSIGLKTLSKEKMHKVSKSLGLAVSDSEDDVVQVEDTEINIVDPVNTSAEEAPTPKRKSERKKKNKEKNKEQKHFVESILSAAHEARQKLLEKYPDQMYGYLSIDKEGNHAFNILNPDSTEESRPVEMTLEKLAPPPQDGLPAGQTYKEDKKSRVVPVNYLLYGPYGSFGPTHDSSLSNTTKEESDLLLQTYGSELGVAYTQSVQEFIGDSVFSCGFADRLLDTITNGKHCALVEKQKAKKREEANKENMETKKANNTTTKPVATGSSTTPTTLSIEQQEVDFESLLTLDGLGIDVSFIKDFVQGNKEEKPKSPSQPTSAQQVLAQNADLLNDLHEQQNTRLTSKHGGSLPVGATELKIATSLVGNLKELLKITKPGDTVPSYGVKKAIGDNNPTTAPTVPVIPIDASVPVTVNDAEDEKPGDE